MAPKEGKRKWKCHTHIRDENKDAQDDAKLTKVNDHLASLQDWGDVSGYQKELDDCGFGHLLLGHKRIPKHCLLLLEALCTFYNPKTFCFNFNDKIKVHFGLLDILFITGLNIDGHAVTGNEGNEKASELFKEIISIPKGEDFKFDRKDGSILLNSLKNLNRDKLSNNDCVKLFCLYSIGAVVCPNSSNTVPKMYIPLLRDVEKIKEFAWGAGMLAAFQDSIRLYKSLNTNRLSQQDMQTQEVEDILLKKRPCQAQLHGPFHPFIVFLCEMIPKFALMMGVKENISPTKFPLMKQWTEALYLSSLNTQTRYKKEDYIEFFSKLRRRDLKLHAYEKMLPCNLPPRVREQVPIGAAIVPVLNFHMEGRNFPHLNFKRFGLSKKEANNFIKSITFVRVKPTKKRGGQKPLEGYRSWNTYFSEAKAQWDHRTEFCMTAADCSTEASPLDVVNLFDRDGKGSAVSSGFISDSVVRGSDVAFDNCRSGGDDTRSPPLTSRSHDFEPDKVSSAAPKDIDTESEPARLKEVIQGLESQLSASNLKVHQLEASCSQLIEEKNKRVEEVTEELHATQMQLDTCEVELDQAEARATELDRLYSELAGKETWWSHERGQFQELLSQAHLRIASLEGENSWLLKENAQLQDDRS